MAEVAEEANMVAEEAEEAEEVNTEVEVEAVAMIDMVTALANVEVVVVERMVLAAEEDMEGGAWVATRWVPWVRN